MITIIENLKANHFSFQILITNVQPFIETMITTPNSNRETFIFFD